MRVGEDPPPFAHAVGQHAEVFVQQHDVGSVLGDVGRRIDRDADIGGVQCDCIVDAVAEEGDVDARARATLMMPRLLIGLNAREDGRCRDRRGERRRRRAGRSRAPVSIRSTARPMSRQTLAATVPLSPVMILTAMPSCASFGDRRAGVGLGAVDEREEAREVEITLVCGVGATQSGCGARCDRDDAGAVVEEASSDASPRAGTSTHRASTASGAPFVTSANRPAAAGERRRPAAARGRRAAARAARMRRGPSQTSRAAAAGAETARGRARCRRPGPAAVIVASLQTRPRAVARRRDAARHRAMLEGDRALGERARLVGEQDLDVAEILDRDEALDEHPLASEPARSACEADRDDRRQQLRGDADGDRQREQQRLDQRPSRGDVDDEDRDGEDARDLDEQAPRNRAAQPGRPSRPAARRARPRSGRRPSPSRSRRPPRAPEPWWTIVPMKAQTAGPTASRRAGRRRRLRRPAATRPVSTASSHSSPSPRAAAGRPDDVADAERDESPGTSRSTSTRSVVPSRHDQSV